MGMFHPLLKFVRLASPIEQVMLPCLAVQELAWQVKPQGKELLVGLQPPGFFGGFHHSGGRPTQRHLGILPSFDVTVDAQDGAVHILDDVGACKRAAQLGGKAETGGGQGFVDAFQVAAGDVGGLVFQAAAR